MLLAIMWGSAGAQAPSVRGTQVEIDRAVKQFHMNPSNSSATSLVFLAWLKQVVSGVLFLIAFGVVVDAAHAQSIGGALEELTRKLPGKLQDGARQALDPAAGRSSTNGSPDQRAPSTTPTSPMQAAQGAGGGAIAFPSLPCVLASNIQARGKMAYLTNNCGHHVSVLAFDKHTGKCQASPFPPGITNLYAPVAVCDFNKSGASACTCDAAVSQDANAAAMASKPSQATRQDATDSTCLTMVQDGKTPYLRNGCDHDLGYLRQAQGRDGCKTSRFPRSGHLSLGNVLAVCESPQTGSSCACGSRTLWRRG